MENVPHRFTCFNTWSQKVALFGEFLDMRGLAGGFESVEMDLEGNTYFWFSLSSLLPGCYRGVANGHTLLLLCSLAPMDHILQLLS